MLLLPRYCSQSNSSDYEPVFSPPTGDKAATALILTVGWIGCQASGLGDYFLSNLNFCLTFVCDFTVPQHAADMTCSSAQGSYNFRSDQIMLVCSSRHSGCQPYSNPHAIMLAVFESRVPSVIVSSRHLESCKRSWAVQLLRSSAAYQTSLLRQPL